MPRLLTGHLAECASPNERRLLQSQRLISYALVVGNFQFMVQFVTTSSRFIGMTFNDLGPQFTTSAHDAANDVYSLVVVVVAKAAYWCHSREHINPKDLFDCPACEFATRFKHHMMYHVLSHLDINPYSCSECGYPCKNKSMLKSHMKTHTNVYQYRCAYNGCTFVTKYCHAMNQHLAK